MKTLLLIIALTIAVGAPVAAQTPDAQLSGTKPVGTLTASAVQLTPMMTVCSPEGGTLPKCPEVTTRWQSEHSLEPIEIGFRSDGIVVWRIGKWIAPAKYAHTSHQSRDLSGAPIDPSPTQQDKPAAVIPAPVVFRLSAEATKELITLSQQRVELVRQMADIDDKQRLVMVGAQVPEAARRNCMIPNGESQVICAVPAPEAKKQ